MQEILTKEVGEVERICVKFLMEVSERNYGTCTLKIGEPCLYNSAASSYSAVEGGPLGPSIFGLTEAPQLAELANSFAIPCILFTYTYHLSLIHI